VFKFWYLVDLNYLLRCYCTLLHVHILGTIVGMRDHVVIISTSRFSRSYTWESGRHRWYQNSLALGKAICPIGRVPEKFKVVN
jgi:hypothetical protein